MDLLVLTLATHYWAGLLLIVLAVIAAAGLALLAFRLPPRRFEPPALLPRARPAAFLLLGLAFYPILLLVPAVGEHLGWVAILTGAMEIVLCALLLGVVRGTIGHAQNEPHRILLAVGAIAPIMVFGLIAQILIPIVLLADVLAALYFLTLWRRYRTGLASVGMVAPA